MFVVRFANLKSCALSGDPSGVRVMHMPSAEVRVSFEGALSGQIQGKIVHNQLLVCSGWVWSTKLQLFLVSLCKLRSPA